VKRVQWGADDVVNRKKLRHALELNEVTRVYYPAYRNETDALVERNIRQAAYDWQRTGERHAVTTRKLRSGIIEIHAVTAFVA